MATPIVAGSLALIRQNYVDELNITPSAALLKATLINGATDLHPGQYGNDVTAQPDYSQGWGLVNLKESLHPSSGSIHFADNVELETGDVIEKNYYVNNSSNPLKATLVWTDYYGTELAQKELVNDLTLHVAKPDGTEIVVDDTVNNVEQVMIEEPEVGWYTVKVIGESVPMGPQPCAIVVSGSSATISSLNFTPQQTTYYTGNNTTFEALATDENNNSLNVPFTWESSNSTVASINSSTGYFSALAQGITNITVNAGTMSSTVSINVLNPGNSTTTNESSQVITNEEEEIEEETTSSSSSRSSSGGGGSGGGGTSGENIANVLVKDSKTVFISMDKDIRYEFTEEDNNIGYIEFTPLKNSGKITAVVEVLKTRSSFAKSNVPGTVYQNVNIWVGKTGFATESNIADPIIGFKVSKEWMANKNIGKENIRLYRYNADTWNELKTTNTDEDNQYVYFESQTPGFSPFAISTAQQTTTEILSEVSDTENNTSDNVIKPLDQSLISSTNYTGIDQTEDQNNSLGDRNGLLTKFIMLSIILVISGIVYWHYNKRR
jgi:PGF-pre-PGF domain-containing protein